MTLATNCKGNLGPRHLLVAKSRPTRQTFHTGLPASRVKTAGFPLACRKHPCLICPFLPMQRSFPRPSWFVVALGCLLVGGRRAHAQQPPHPAPDPGERGVRETARPTGRSRQGKSTVHGRLRAPGHPVAVGLPAGDPRVSRRHAAQQLRFLREVPGLRVQLLAGRGGTR